MKKGSFWYQLEVLAVLDNLITGHGLPSIIVQ